MSRFIHNTISIAVVCASMVGALMLSIGVNAQDLEDETDGSWVAISGKVVSHTPSQFVLDYGEDTVLVETDDWDSLGDGWRISEGDDVTVYGIVDDDLYERRTIEAGSVYVEDLNTMVTAPVPDDEEGAPFATYTYFSIPADYDFQIAGTVTSVSGREFTVDTGTRKVTVDTIQMGYNPLDDIGFQKIDTGDFVSVSGDLDIDVFDGRELSAESIVSYD